MYNLLTRYSSLLIVEFELVFAHWLSGSLAYFKPMFHFYTPWKLKGFLSFSGVYHWNIWLKWVKFKIETLLGINSLLILKLNKEICERQVSIITRKKILREHALALQMLLLINIFILILTILTQGLLAPSMQYSLEKRSNVFRVLLTFKDIWKYLLFYHMRLLKQ